VKENDEFNQATLQNPDATEEAIVAGIAKRLACQLRRLTNRWSPLRTGRCADTAAPAQ